MRIAVIGVGFAAVLVAATTPGAFAPTSDFNCTGVSDALEVQTSVGPPSVVFPGGFGNGAFSIGNHHPSVTASVQFNVFIEFTGGVIQRLTGLGSPVTLGPGQAFVQFITFIVPSSAPSGPAVLTCRACATFQGVPPSRAFAFHNSTFTVQ